MHLGKLFITPQNKYESQGCIYEFEGLLLLSRGLVSDHCNNSHQLWQTMN